MMQVILTTNQKENVSLIAHTITEEIAGSYALEHSIAPHGLALYPTRSSNKSQTSQSFHRQKKSVSIVKRLTVCTHAKVFLCGDARISEEKEAKHTHTHTTHTHMATATNAEIK